VATFETMKDRLSLVIAGHKTEEEIGDLLNRVHQEEVEAYEWHDRHKRTLITTKAVKTAGTIVIAQDSAAVVGTGTAFASGDVNSFLRPGSDEILIRVSAFTSTVAITLDTAWPGTALSGSSYELFPLYYSLPADCREIRMVSRNGVPLKKRAREEFNLWDPSRQSSASLALSWAPAGVDSSDNMQIEFWPHNTDAVLYAVEYMAGHTDMAADADVPLMPSSVIENKALHDICMAEFFRSGDARWQQGAVIYHRRYQEELTEAKKVDVARFGKISQIQDDLGNLPLDHDYRAKHDLVG
jgi:hypothetical protein